MDHKFLNSIKGISASQIPRLVDILGILFFIILFAYFAYKDSPTWFEIGLMILTGIALILDSIFVAMYFNGV